MGLNRYKLGSLITPIDERNTFGYRDFYGINIHKEFMPTVANTEGLDETKYKVVRKNRFVFSGMQTGRDQCIRISMYAGDNPIIVSPAYTTFEVTAVDIVLPMYFFMLFLSKERDRLGAFYSDGSIRSNLDWERFCDIELDLPSVSVQQKYVDIYNAMIVNQQSYECGLEDLKLVCDGYIEDLRQWTDNPVKGESKKKVRLLTDQIQRAANIYHTWQSEGTDGSNYAVPELYRSVSLQEIDDNGWSLVPSKYIEFIDHDLEIDFPAEMARIQDEMKTIISKEKESQQMLLDAFKGIGYEL